MRGQARDVNTPLSATPRPVAVEESHMRDEGR